LSDGCALFGVARSPVALERRFTLVFPPTGGVIPIGEKGIRIIAVVCGYYITAVTRQIA